jgi:hypothetical protein
MKTDIIRIREHCDEALDHDMGWWSFRELLMSMVELGDIREKK